MKCAALIGGIAIASLASVAQAAAGSSQPAAAAFGKTIVSTYPDGRTAELWLQPSGSYTARGRRGDASSGHWKVKGRRICLSQSRPFPGPFSYCTSLPHSGTWSARAVTGEPISVRIVAGRYSGRA
jgi:hypothetical protein